MQTLVLDGMNAEPIVRKHLEQRADSMQRALSKLIGSIESKAEALGIPAEQFCPQLAEAYEAVHPSFENDDRVEVLTSGAGRRWHDHAIIRTGSIIKSGHTEYSYLVMLDEPINRLDDPDQPDKIININALELREASPDSDALQLTQASNTGDEISQRARDANTSPAAVVLDDE